MPAIRFQTSDQFGAPGVYVRQIQVPAAIRGLLRNTVGVVGRCVRGPVNRPVVCGSYSRFLQVFGGRDRGAGGAVVGHVWRFFQANRLGQVVVVRPLASSVAAVAADFTWEDAAGGAGATTIKIAAANVGAWGQDVQFKISAATDGDGTHFNCTIRYLGKDYLLENCDTSGTNDNLALKVLQAFGDSDAALVTITKLGNTRPVNTAAGIDGADTDAFVNLGEVVAGFASTVGVDGTLQDTDYTGANKGMEIINAYGGVGICLVVGNNAAAIRVKAYALAPTAYERLWLVNPTDSTVSYTAAAADAASYRDERVMYLWNHPTATDPETGETVTRDPAEWMAGVLSQTLPYVHPAVIDNAALLRGITGVTYEMTPDIADALDAAGVTFLQKDLDDGGNTVYRFGNAVTTDLAADNRQAAARRMKDYLIRGLASRMNGDLFRGNTPQARQARKAECSAWLRERTDHYVAVNDDLEPQFEYLNDDEVNAQADVDIGRQTDLARIKLAQFMIYAQLRVEVGPTVKVTES